MWGHDQNREEASGCGPLGDQLILFPMPHPSLTQDLYKTPGSQKVGPKECTDLLYRSALALLLKVWTHNKSISQDPPLLPLCQSQLNSFFFFKVYCSLSLKFIIQIQETRTWKPLMQCEFCVTMSTRHPNSQSKTYLQGHRSHLLNSKHLISLGSYKWRSASLNDM